MVAEGNRKYHDDGDKRDPPQRCAHAEARRRSLPKVQ
jgi:hypothetical protein